jgi:hypothetical protein
MNHHQSLIDTIIDEERFYQHRVNNGASRSTLAHAFETPRHLRKRINPVANRFRHAGCVLWRSLINIRGDFCQFGKRRFGYDDAVTFAHPKSFSKELVPYASSHGIPIFNLSSLDLILCPVNRFNRSLIQPAHFYFVQRPQSRMNNIINRFILAAVQLLFQKFLRLRTERNGHGNILCLPILAYPQPVS